MNRTLFLLHRYLGIGLGLVVSIWCLSGVVMMYVEYPALTAQDEVASLEGLDLGSCCRSPLEAGSRAESPLAALRVQMLAGTPVVQLESLSGERRTIDLASGRSVAQLDRRDAEDVARAFARTAGIEDYHYERQIARDQWTVYAAYDAHRPLHKFAALDADRTQWYVSSRTGEIVQITTARERFWNWLGAVPHWLYPTILRQHTFLWSQVVIWLTIVATFLTVLGVYVGIRQFRSRRSGRYSPYRSASLWHHYAGLIFGVLMLTWLISGFFSMNPWGALESRSFAAEVKAQQGADLTFSGSLAASGQELSRLELPAGTVRLASHVVNGVHFFVAWNRNGDRSLLGDAFDDVVPYTQSVFGEAAARIRPGRTVAAEGWIDQDDAYYFSHHEEMALPVYRIVYTDGERYYLDALSGEIVYVADQNRQLYRWLHYALHRGDFSAFVRKRPVWDMFMLTLMLGVSVSALTGTWIGIRRIRRSLRSYRAQKIPRYRLSNRSPSSPFS